MTRRPPLQVSWPIVDRDTGEVFEVRHWPRQRRWECGRCGDPHPPGRLCAHAFACFLLRFDIGTPRIREELECEHCGGPFMGPHRAGCIIATGEWPA